MSEKTNPQTEDASDKVFDFRKHLIKVQGNREYLPVQARLIWFRMEHPDWGIVTDLVEINHEKQFAVFRANIFHPDGRIVATATKKEDAKGFGDYIEKAETGAIGRALALCGYGTQFTSELDERDRLADSPRAGHSAPDTRPAANHGPHGAQRAQAHAQAAARPAMQEGDVDLQDEARKRRMQAIQIRIREERVRIWGDPKADQGPSAKDCDDAYRCWLFDQTGLKSLKDAPIPLQEKVLAQMCDLPVEDAFASEGAAGYYRRSQPDEQIAA